MSTEHNSIVEEAEQYIKTTTELYTLKVTEKVAVVVSSVFSKLILGFFFSIVLFLFSMGLAFWIGDLIGELYLGFLIIGGVVGVVSWILYAKRSTMIKKPIMNSIISQILK